MKYLIILGVSLIAILLVKAVYAEEVDFEYSLTEVTTREDGKTATGAITYKVFGGNPGGPYTELLESSELTGAGKVELVEKKAEFYATACEDGACGAPSGIVPVECLISVIGGTSLTINLTCN